MAITTALRLNMTGLAPSPAGEALRYQAAIDMAAYADQNGFNFINLEEHHCAANGWLPSPLTLAAAIAARTQHARIGVTALLVTLYDPIRLAEDIAVLDLISNGRFSFVAGMGYRPIEYHAMGKQWEDRGKLMDDVIDTLLKAWSGEPFDYKGKLLCVTPKPQSIPHPFFFIGGMSIAAAKRAARFGVPFYPPVHRPDLEQVYHKELQRHGKKGFVYYPKGGNTMLFVAENPEQAWEESGPCFLREMQEYSSWKVDGVPRPSEDQVSTVEDVRKSGRFTILTPGQCIEKLSSGDEQNVVLHPLAGGVPIEHGWQSLRLFTEKVLPHIC